MKKLLLIASLFAAGIARAANPIISYVQISTGVTQTGGFKTQTGTVVNSMNLPYVGGVQCLRSVNGAVSGTGADCGASLISGSSNTIIASPQFQIPFYSTAGTSNTLTGASGFSWYGSSAALSGALVVNGPITLKDPNQSYNLTSSSGQPFAALTSPVSGLQTVEIAPHDGVGIGINSIGNSGGQPYLLAGGFIGQTYGSLGVYGSSTDLTTTYSGFTSTNNVTKSVLWALPRADGLVGQVLSTDGATHLGFSSVASIASTQTWTGANTFLSTTTMGNGAVVVYPSASPVQMSVTGPLALPSLTANQCLQTDGSSRIVTSGASCGSGGGGGGGVTGTIVPASQYSSAYYSLFGPTTTVAGLAPATSGYVLTSAGLSFPPFFGPAPTGIVSPGTFTWTNNQGLIVSTITSGSSPLGTPNFIIRGTSDTFRHVLGATTAASATLDTFFSSNGFGPDAHSTYSDTTFGGLLRGWTWYGDSIVPNQALLNVDNWNNGGPATVNLEAPGGLNVTYNVATSTLTVTSTATVQALALTGIGELTFQNGSDTTTYKVIGASQTLTVGHSVIVSQDDALIDGGPPQAFANGPKYSVQVASGVLFSGSNNFQFNGSSLTIISSVTIGGGNTNSTPGLLNVDDSLIPYVGKPLLTLGSTLLGNQVVFPDHQPTNMSNYGALLGNIQAGANASPDSLYDAAHATTQFINFWNSGEMNFATTDAPSGGKGFAFSPNGIRTVFISTGALTVASSTTIQGAGGLGVTYNVTAATFTALSGVAFTQSYKGAVCQAGTASLGFSTFSSSGPTAACAISTSTVMGVAPFVDTSSMSVQDHFTLPSDWVGAVNANILWNSTTTANSVVWQIRTGCAASGAQSAVTWNSFSTVTDAAISPTNALNTASISGITTTNCAAGNEMFFEFFRDPTNASDTLTATANLVTLQLTYRRTLAL